MKPDNELSRRVLLARVLAGPGVLALASVPMLALPVAAAPEVEAPAPVFDAQAWINAMHDNGFGICPVGERDGFYPVRYGLAGLMTTKEALALVPLWAEVAQDARMAAVLALLDHRSLGPSGVNRKEQRT